MSAVRLPLETPNKVHPMMRDRTQWKTCAPFVENTAAFLIHRPRAAFVLRHQEYAGRKTPPHLILEYWCGMHSHWRKNHTFLDAPPEEAIVCHRCELLAVNKGRPPSSVLAGRHVHIGGVKAYKLCCPDSEPSTNGDTAK